MNPILRSALTTFISSALALIPLAPLSDEILIPVVYAAAIAALRTILAFIDPQNTTYGIGATHPDEPEAPEVVDTER